jgi:DNA gyrase/topoisomerase IV subunit B
MSRKGNEPAPTNVREFVIEAFDYLAILEKCSINHSANRGLLEYVANGYVKYGNSENFKKNIDKWLKSVASVFREIGYDHSTNQIYSVIELTDNFVMIDDELITELSSVIDILKKYGLMIHYTSNKRKIDEQCELSHFFEYIEDIYPQIKGRYKGLGSSDPEVLREVVMDPSVRRIYRVTMNDAIVMSQMGALVGQGKDYINQRKDMLMNFKFTKADIDS